MSIQSFNLKFEEFLSTVFTFTIQDIGGAKKYVVQSEIAEFVVTIWNNSVFFYFIKVFLKDIRNTLNIGEVKSHYSCTNLILYFVN